METTIKHIELINQYLNNLLSGESKSEFIHKLNTDSEFYQLFQDQKIIVEGIHRAALKQEIANAKQSYTTTKWIKVAGISIIVISTFVLIYTLLNSSKSNIEQPQPDQNNAFIQNKNVEEQSEKQIADFDTIVNNTLSGSVVDLLGESKIAHTSKVFEPFKKQSQLLNVDVSKDTIIKCEEGTILKIKANSFVHSGSSRPVKGKIDIEVTEYYRLSDILLANLTTTSNGAQLETGGMLYIDAHQDESMVELKPNATIDILLPTQNKKESMQLFSGLKSEDGIDWIPESKSVANFGTDAISVANVEEAIIEVPFALVDQAPVFPGCETVSESQRRQCFNDALNRFIQRNFNLDIPKQSGLTGKQRITSTFKIDENGDIGFIQTNAPRPELMNEANRVLGMLPRLQPGQQRGRNVIVPYSIPIIFQIEDDDTIISNSRNINRDSVNISFIRVAGNPTVYDTILVPSRGMVERIREIMHDPNFDVDSSFLQQWNQFRKENLIREFNKSYSNRKFLFKKQVFETTDSRFKILEDDSITRGGHVIRIPWDKTKIPTTSTMIQIIPRQTYTGGNEALTAEEFQSRVEDTEKTKNITTTDVNNYILKTSKLGWINCDRFIRTKGKKIKYKLKIKNSDNTVVNMVFKSFNSVLPGRKFNEEYDFGMLLDAYNVVLVAIKKEDGKLFLDIVDTKTISDPNVDFNFKEVTLQEMQSELKNLNSLFD